jgi:hypothetical protein
MFVKALDIEVPHRDFDESYHFTNCLQQIPPPPLAKGGKGKLIVDEF